MDQDTIDKSELSFSTREQCIMYLDELLRHKMFHRAKKIPVAEKVSKKDKKEKDKEKGKDTFKLLFTRKKYILKFREGLIPRY